MTTDVNAMMDAYKLGLQDAQSLKVGDVFKGAFGHFADRGMTDEHLRSMYTAGFCSVLPKRIVTTRDTSVIIELS